MKIFLLFTLATIIPAIIYAQKNENTFSRKVGDAEVILLSEGQRKGNKSILIGATDGMMEKYAPDGTYPNATNAFLIKIDGKNILVDTGYGRDLEGNLKTYGVAPEQIDILIITHMHGDHIGGMLKGGKKVFPNAEVLISKPEIAYWSSDENRKGEVRNVLEAYKDVIRPFDPVEIGEKSSNKLLGVDFALIAAYGHTPGHICLLVESQGEKLLVWGDLTHAMAIQMPYPEVAVTYDVDPETAVKYRKKILEYVAKNNIPIAGMHIAYPAMGNVSAKSEGGYEFIPFR